MKQNRFEDVDWAREFAEDTETDVAIRRLFVAAGAGIMAVLAIAVVVTLWWAI